MNGKGLALAAVGLAWFSAALSAQTDSGRSFQETYNSQFREMDSRLGRLSVLAGEFEKFVAESIAAFKRPDGGPKKGEPSALRVAALKSLSERCHAAFSMKAAIEAAALGRAATPPGSAEPAALQYYQCLAYAENNPNLCAHLKAFRLKDVGPDMQPEPICRRERSKMVLAQALISKRADAAKRCEQVLSPLGATTLEKEVTPQACALLLSGGDPQSVCSKVGRLEHDLDPVKLKECVISQRMLLGDESVCLLVKDTTAKELCPALASYRKAYEAKDAQLCGNSAVCRLLMEGSAASCEGFAKMVKKAYCDWWVAAKFDEQKPGIEEQERQLARIAKPSKKTEIMETLKQKREGVLLALGELDKMVEGFEPKSLPGYRARRDRFHLQRKKFESALKRFKSATGQ